MGYSGPPWACLETCWVTMFGGRSLGCIKLAIPALCDRGVSPKRPYLDRGGRLGEAFLPELEAALGHS
jgi:hypothetical protein